jgi:hypothetical protein
MYALFVDPSNNVRIPLKIERSLEGPEDTTMLTFIDRCFLWDWKRGNIDDVRSHVNWSHIHSVMYDIDSNQCAMTEDLTRLKVGLGSYLMNLSDQLNRAVGVDFCTLTDASKKTFCNQHMSFARFMLLDRGTTWYQSYLYMPIYSDLDQVNNSKQYIDNTLQHFNHDLEHLIDPLQKATLHQVLTEMREDRQELEAAMQRRTDQLYAAMAEFDAAGERAAAAAAEAGVSDAEDAPAPFSMVRLTEHEGWAPGTAKAVAGLCASSRRGGGKIVLWPSGVEPLDDNEGQPGVVVYDLTDRRYRGRMGGAKLTRDLADVLAENVRIVDIHYSKTLTPTFYHDLISVMTQVEEVRFYTGSTLLITVDSEQTVTHQVDSPLTRYLDAKVQSGIYSINIERAEQLLEAARKEMSKSDSALAFISEYSRQQPDATLYAFLRHVTQSMFKGVHAACDLFTGTIDKGLLPVLGNKLKEAFMDDREVAVSEFVRFYQADTGEALQFKYTTTSTGLKQLEYMAG